jgi:hypothetical protein
MATPVLMVMLAWAMMFPAILVPVPSVAELPTCQNTFPPQRLLSTMTAELVAVVSVLPILKT